MTVAPAPRSPPGTNDMITGSLSPARTPTASGSSTSRSTRARADRWRLFPRRLRGHDARTPWRSRPTARRSSSPTPTTTTSPSSTSPTRARARSKGFIPTGWYPDLGPFDPDGKRIYVCQRQGPDGRTANPRGPEPVPPARTVGQYIGSMLQGTLRHRRARREGADAAYTARGIAVHAYATRQR